METKQSTLHWPTVYIDDCILVRASSSLPETEIDADLRMIGPGFRVPLSDWMAFLIGGGADFCCHELQKKAFSDVIQVLRDSLPDTETIMQRIKDATDQTDQY